MNDSYTRAACGIRPFTPTRTTRLIDAAIFAAAWLGFVAKVASFF